jgi:ribosomal protein S12
VALTSYSADLRSENKGEQTKRKRRKHQEKENALEHCDQNKPIVKGEEMI